MKKTLFTLGAMAFAAMAPVVTAAPKPAPAAPAASASQKDTDNAIKRYVYKTAAITLDGIADTIAESDGSTLSQSRAMVKCLRATLDLPIDELPAEHQPYAREAYDVSKPYLEQLETLLNQREAGKIDEEELGASLTELLQKAQDVQNAVEAKYPESAKLLGREASQRMSAELLPILEQQARPRVEAYVKEHPEVAKDQQACLAATFHILAQVLREMAESL